MSLSKFFKEAIGYRVSGGHLADHTAMGLLKQNQALNVCMLGDSITSLNYSGSSPISVTAVGTTITVNLVNHGQWVGAPIIIETYTQTGYNGCWKVASVIDANYFTVIVATAPSASPATGSGFVRLSNKLTNNGIGNWAQTVVPGMNLINSGVGGNSTVDVYNRLQKDCLSLKPDVVVLGVGINDINVTTLVNPVTARSAAATWNGGDASTIGIKTIIDAILLANIPVVVMAITAQCYLSPLTGNPGNYEGVLVGGLNIRQRTMQLNKYIKDYCASVPGLYYCDAYSWMVDNAYAAHPGAAKQVNTGAPADYTQDGLHPSPIAAYYVGTYALAPILQKLTPKVRSLVNSIQDDYFVDNTSTNAQPNPLFITAGSAANLGTGATGAVQAGWKAEMYQGTGAIACSVVARTIIADGDVCGNNQVCTFTSTGTSDQGALHSRVSFSAPFTFGAGLQAEMDVALSAAVNLKDFQVILTVVVDGVSYYGIWNTSSTSLYIPQVGWRCIVRTPKIVVPAGSVVTSYQVALQPKFSAAGGSVTITVGRAAIWMS